MSAPLIVLTGGTRSGKSLHAERLATTLAGPSGVSYLATGDPSLGERITAHQARRPASWRTVEVGRDPAAALHAARGRTILLDGLGAWIASELHHADAFTDPAGLERATAVVRERLTALLAALDDRNAPVLVVTEEAGLAPVAADAATRRWVDLLGEATQAIAEHADHVLLVVAGRVLTLPPDLPAAADLLDGDLDDLDEAVAMGRLRDPMAALAALAPPLPPLDGIDGVRRRALVPVDSPEHAGTQPTPASAPAASLVIPDRPVHGDRMVPPGHDDAAVNVLPGGPPPWLAKVLRDALSGAVQQYPDERQAAGAVARRHGLPAEHALALNGAAEGFWLIAAALQPKRAIVLTPSFTEPATALQAFGHPLERLGRAPEDGWALRPELVPQDADLVVLCNPCNPTGVLHPAEAVAALARPGRTLVVDESFMDLVERERETLAGRTDVPGLVVLRSLTKSLAIPGLRAGYLLADPALVLLLAARRQSWPVNALALAALEAFGSRPTATAAQAERVARDRELLEDDLLELGVVHVHPAAANFLLLEIPDGARVRTRLAEQRIAVRPTEDLGLGPDHLRVAVRGGEADARLVEALRVAVDG